MVKLRFIPFFIPVLVLSLLLMSTNVFGDETVPGKSDFIVISTLSTPPPGYKIVNSLGPVFVDEYSDFMIKGLVFNSSDNSRSEVNKNVDLVIAKAEASFAANATAKGANAILNKRTDLKIGVVYYGVTGSLFFFSVTIEGEAVVLERIK